MLAPPSTFHPASRVDVSLTLLPSGKPLKDRARVHLHAYAFETIATSPVAVDGVTVMFTVTVAPAVMVVGLRLRVTVVGVKALTPVLQLLTRFWAFTEPSPVAKS